MLLNPAVLICSLIGILSVPTVGQPQQTPQDALVVAMVDAGPDVRLIPFERRPISLGEFRRKFRDLADAYKRAARTDLKPEALMSVAEKALDDLIDREVQMIEAERMRIIVSDAEVRQHIHSLPNLQENGRFIGDQRYKDLLRKEKTRLEEFEKSVRYFMLVDKLSAVVTAVKVTDKEVSAEMKHRRQRASDWGPNRLTADAVRVELTNVARQKAFDAYIQKARAKMKITKDKTLVAQVAAGR